MVALAISFKCVRTSLSVHFRALCVFVFFFFCGWLVVIIFLQPSEHHHYPSYVMPIEGLPTVVLKVLRGSGWQSGRLKLHPARQTKDC